LLLEIKDELDDNNLIADALTLIEKVQQQQPKLYKQEFPYLDTFRINYYLFCNHLELVQTSLNQFQVNPIDGIEQITSVINLLSYYGAKDILIVFCRSVYQQVENTGLEDELVKYIIQDLVERTYFQLERGETVDWGLINTEITQYSVKNQQLAAKLRQDLTTKLVINEQLFTNLKNEREIDNIFCLLSIAFSGYMATKKQVSFITSQAIWETIFEFLANRKLPKKQLSHPDTYFQISEKQLDEYAGKLIGGLFSDQQALSVTLVWGIPYIYDFLFSKNIITEAVHQEAIAVTVTIKTHLIKFFNDHLWKYSFVHRWIHPDSLSLVDFIAEAAMFTASIEKVTPLSLKIDKSALKSMFSQIEDGLPAEILEELNKNKRLNGK
jgi:dihydrofolate reductase